MDSSSSLLGLYWFKSWTVSTQGLGAAVAAVVVLAVFFFPEDDEDPDFFDLSGVFLERERVGRAADICKVEVLLVVVAELATCYLVIGLSKKHFNLKKKHNADMEDWVSTENFHMGYN